MRELNGAFAVVTSQHPLPGYWRPPGVVDVTSVKGQNRTIPSDAISTKHLCEVIVQEHPGWVESAAQGLKRLILLEQGR